MSLIPARSALSSVAKKPPEPIYPRKQAQAIEGRLCRLVNWLFGNDHLDSDLIRKRDQFFSRTLTKLVDLLGFTDRKTASQATARMIHNTIREK